jgi:hypothetical protein
VGSGAGCAYDRWEWDEREAGCVRPRWAEIWKTLELERLSGGVVLLCGRDDGTDASGTQAAAALATAAFMAHTRRPVCEACAACAALAGDLMPGAGHRHRTGREARAARAAHAQLVRLADSLGLLGDPAERAVTRADEGARDVTGHPGGERLAHEEDAGSGLRSGTPGMAMGAVPSPTGEAGPASIFYW